MLSTIILNGKFEKKNIMTILHLKLTLYLSMADNYEGNNKVGGSENRDIFH